MTHPDLYLTVAATALAGLAMLTLASLSGWRSWLQLKQRELARYADAPAPLPNAGQRIEIADLKERIRKLEAIAAGVEL